MSDKFDITKHKNYKLLEDYDKKNVFDIENYIKRKGKVKLNRNCRITIHVLHYNSIKKTEELDLC